MKINLILIVICLFLIQACSDNNVTTKIVINGIEIFNNKNMGYEEVQLNEICKIDFDNYDQEGNNFNTPIDFAIDSFGDIYIIDIMTSSVKKFSSNSQYLLEFCKKGSGPGETIFPTSISVLEDSIYVANIRTREILSYDTKGNYLSVEKYKKAVPSGLNIRHNSFIGYAQEFINGNMYFNLNYYNKRFEKIKCFKSYKVNMNDEFFFDDYLNIFTPFGISSEYVFVSENEDKSYIINAYDKEGNIEYAIKRQFRSILLTDDENVKMVEETKYISGEEPISKFKNKYKKPINYIIPRNNNEIWVITSVERNKKNKNYSFIDVFINGRISKQYRITGLTVQDFNYDNLKYKIVSDKLYQFTPYSLTVFKIDKL